MLARLGDELGRQWIGYTLVAQLDLQTQTAMSTDAAMREAFCITPVGEQVFLFQAVEQGVDVLLAALRGKLAMQLGATVLTSCQQGERPLAQAAFALAQTASTAGAAPPLTPRLRRIWASISAAMSACSLRNSRALSLPWPIFSPW